MTDIETTVAAFLRDFKGSNIGPHLREHFELVFAERDALAAEVERLREELEAAKADAERWRFIRDNRTRSHSLHADGTSGFAMHSGIPGRFRTVTEAVDAMINASAVDAAREGGK